MSSILFLIGYFFMALFFLLIFINQIIEMKEKSLRRRKDDAEWLRLHKEKNNGDT